MSTAAVAESFPVPKRSALDLDLFIGVGNRRRIRFLVGAPGNCR